MKLFGSSQEEDDVTVDIDDSPQPHSQSATSSTTGTVHTFANANTTRKFTEEELKVTPAQEVDDFQRCKMTAVLAIRSIKSRIDNPSINKDIRFATDMSKKLSDGKKNVASMKELQKQARANEGIWKVAANKLSAEQLTDRDTDVQDLQNQVDIIERLINELIKRYKKADEMCEDILTPRPLKQIDISIGAHIAVRAMKMQDLDDTTIRSRLASIGLNDPEITTALQQYSKQ